jgi:hypothetical protein
MLIMYAVGSYKYTIENKAEILLWFSKGMDLEVNIYKNK